MPRLPYDPNNLAFITTVTHQRRPIFRDVRLAERLGTMIHMACRQKGFVLLVYAILPDHVHLLVCSQQLVGRTRESVRLPEPLIVQESVRSTEQNFFKEVGGLSSPPAPQVSAFVRSLKGTFSRTLPHGTVWQRRYHFLQINDVRDATRVIEYIIYNYQHSHVSERFGKEPYVWCDEILIGTLLS